MKKAEQINQLKNDMVYLTGKLHTLLQSGSLHFKTRINGMVVYVYPFRGEVYEITWSEDYMRFHNMKNVKQKMAVFFE